jgi:Fur family transcriptional regulator, peroxide stress response regulator
MSLSQSRAGQAEVVGRFVDACRKAGMKLTHQRLEIYKALAASTDHPSAEDLHRRIRGKLPTVSLDTVYRTLDTLERHSLVGKVPVVKGPARYDAAMHPHHHCVCSKCRKIEDLTWEAVDAMELPSGSRQWGNVTNRFVELYGVCARCNGSDQNAVL